MFNQLSIKSRLLLIIALAAILAIALSTLGLVGMHKANTGLHSVYVDRAVPLADLSEIKNRLLHSRTAIVTVFSFPQDITEQHRKIEDNIAVINKLWKDYLGTYLTPEEKLLADKFAIDNQLFIDTVKKTVVLQSSGQKEDAMKYYFEDVRNAYKPASEGIDALVQLQKNVAKQEYDSAVATYHSITLIELISLAVGIALTLFFGLALVRSLMKQLGGEPKDVAYLVKNIALGQLHNVITLKPGDTGSLLADMKNLQTSINNFVAAQNVMAQRHAEGWIFEKIDASKFPGTFGNMANEINELVATHVAVKMQVIDIVSEYAKGDFSHEMDRLPGDKAKVTLAVDAVKTALLSVNNEIKALVEAGVTGDFSKRSHADQFQFIFKDILNDIDTLVATCEHAFDDTVRVAKALAEGDLTQTVTRDYPGTFGEVKEGLNTTVENLKSMISEIKEAGDTISTAAKEIAAGNNDLSHRTEEQAASLEETAASMQELTSTVQHNSENAKHANELAVRATDTAGTGVHVVSQVVQTMESINESSRRVVDIIGVIDGIAFQTNILALNAAVEAARAGEQGRGFAVVAGEVRNLAQRAAAAAGEIKALIGDSVDQIEDGARLVTNAGKTMEDIVNSIRGVTAIMSEIAAASLQQTSGIEQVNLAIGQMDDVTQQNAALVEQAAAAAESLEEQTQSLSATIGQFKVDGRSAGRLAPEFSNAAIRSYTTNKPAAKVQTYKASAAPGQEMPSINFDDVLEKHSAWKVKLRAAINQKETLDAATISKDNCCDFGKWLYGDAKTQVGQRASYTECVKKHAAFHVEAGKIATLINAKKYQEADTLLAAGSMFNSASNDVGIAVMRLKKDATTPPKQAKKPVVTDEWEEF